MANTSFASKQISAIPSTYRGVRFRSRMEAQCACLLDHMGLHWDYEPASFVLPSGRAYTPDFVVSLQNGKSICVESRGYDSDDSIKQLVEFGEHFPSFGFSSYIAIGPLWCNIWLLDGTEGGAIIRRCDECGIVQFGHWELHECAFGCVGTLLTVSISLEHGKILINQLPPGRWLEDETFAYFYKEAGTRL